jgi:hypothetical protein
MDGIQKKMKLSKKVIFICEKKLVTNNKKLVNSYICHSGCPNYQITPVVFFPGWLGRGRGGLRLTLLD